MNHLKAEVTATEFWREQIATLKDVGDLLKEELPDIKPERNTDSGKRERPSAGGERTVGVCCIHAKKESNVGASQLAPQRSQENKARLAECRGGGHTKRGGGFVKITKRPLSNRVQGSSSHPAGPGGPDDVSAGRRWTHQWVLGIRIHWTEIACL